jgi:hypothetical protein
VKVPDSHNQRARLRPSSQEQVWSAGMTDEQCQDLGPSGCSSRPELLYLSQLLGESVFQERSVHRHAVGMSSSMEAPRQRSWAPIDSIRQMRRGQGLLVYGHLRPAPLRLRLSWRDRRLRRLARPADAGDKGWAQDRRWKARPIGGA